MDRNPSPPPTLENVEEREESDFIGATTYSRLFVLTSLDDLLKAMRVRETVLDDDLEGRMCSLWDMTAEKAVVGYLLNCDIVKIIDHVIEKTEEARLAEIMTGMAANILCALKNDDIDDEVKISDADNELLKKTILSLMSCRDTPTLTEAARALHAALEKRIWRIESEREVESCLELNFIVSSTTNERLLSRSSQCLDLLIEESDQFRRRYCALENCTQNLMEGVKQAAADGQSEALAALFHVSYLLTTEADGLELIREKSSLIFQTTSKALDSILTSAIDGQTAGIDQLSETHWSILATTFSIWTAIVALEWAQMAAENVTFGSIASILEEATEHRGVQGGVYETFLTQLEIFAGEMDRNLKADSVHERATTGLDKILNVLRKRENCDKKPS